MNSNESTIPTQSLQQICDWFDELQDADSYRGFTYGNWVARCPTNAFEIVKANLRVTTETTT